MDKRFDGSVVVITGGSRGIGRATAIRFAREGARVAINHLDDREEAQSVIAEIEDAGGTAIAVEGDISQRQAAHDLITATEENLGTPDVLVNNAGTTSHVPFSELSVDEWHRIIGVNLDGVFHCCQAVFASFLERRSGSIINVASDLGLVGGVDVAHYAASKGGVIALTKSLAREAAPHGVNVNAVAPGPIETQMLTSAPEEFNDEFLSQIPIGRWGQPADIAATICFLASSDASYYAGWVLSPNGGLVM